MRCLIMPERSDGYQLPSWPKSLIDRLLWNTTMADIHARLTTREELEASFESLMAQGIQASLDYIQVNVAPQIANLQTSIDLAQAQIDQIIIGGKAPDTLRFGGQLPAFYAAAQDLSEGLAGKVPNARKVNGKELSDDVTLEKSDVGLGNVDNTADKDKPVSSLQADEIAKRLRVDAPQGLTSAQKTSALKNLGLSDFVISMLDDIGGSDVWATMGALTWGDANNGGVRLPDGRILQWGRAVLSAVQAYNPSTISGWTWYTHFYQLTLPQAFPNAAIAVIAGNSGFSFAAQGPLAGITVCAGFSGRDKIDIAVSAPGTGNVPFVSWAAWGR